MRNERTRNRLPEFCGTIDALEQSLRTFCEAFALFVQLTQHLQTRSLFGECAMQRRKILFRLSKQFFLFAHAALNVERLTTGGIQRDSDVRDEFFARFS